MQRLTLLAAAAAASLVVHAPAHATASSSASLGDFSWTLIDLNPGDGVAASISFAGSSYVYTYTYNSSIGYTDSNSAAGTTALDPVATSSNDSYSSSLASVTATSISSSGQTTGSPVAGQWGYYEGTGYLNGNASNSFTLSPYTAVIFNGNATTSASATASYNAGATPEWASANVYLWGSIGNGNNSSTGSSSFAAYADNYSGTAYTQSGPLFVTLANSTATALDGTIYGYAQSSGYSYAAAVPEPETYALMLAGLGIVGFIARRRQRS